MAYSSLGAYTGGQATFYNGHKIFVLFWPVCFSKLSICTRLTNSKEQFLKNLLGYFNSVG